jgi:hypothetical protein
MKQLNTELVKFMNWYKLEYPKGTDKTSSMIVHEYLQKNGFKEQIKNALLTNFYSTGRLDSNGSTDMLGSTSEFEIKSKWWELFKQY